MHLLVWRGLSNAPATASDVKTYTAYFENRKGKCIRVMICQTSYLKKIELHAAFHVDDFVLALAELLRLECRVLDEVLHVVKSTEVREARDFQRRGSVDQVRHVEVLDVVSGEDVRVDCMHKI